MEDVDGFIELRDIKHPVLGPYMDAHLDDTRAVT
jgi:hypothetical protein